MLPTLLQHYDEQKNEIDQSLDTQQLEDVNVKLLQHTFKQNQRKIISMQKYL